MQMGLRGERTNNGEFSANPTFDFTSSQWYKFLCTQTVVVGGWLTYYRPHGSCQHTRLSGPQDVWIFILEYPIFTGSGPCERQLFRAFACSVCLTVKLTHVRQGDHLER